MRSRLAMAVIGIVLIGGVAGFVGALSAPRPPATSVAQSGTPTATSADQATTSPTDATSATPTDTIAVPPPTNTQVPPTPNTAFNHTGRIISVNSTTQPQTFTFTTTISGVTQTFTVHWTSTGQCSGLTNDCSNLALYTTSMNSNYRATVVGTLQTGQYVEAATIAVFQRSDN